jgi:hypothetical protein
MVTTSTAFRGPPAGAAAVTGHYYSIQTFVGASTAFSLNEEREPVIRSQSKTILGNRVIEVR